jgi:hypothetical protein
MSVVTKTLVPFWAPIRSQVTPEYLDKTVFPSNKKGPSEKNFHMPSTDNQTNIKSALVPNSDIAIQRDFSLYNSFATLRGNFFTNCLVVCEIQNKNK